MGKHSTERRDESHCGILALEICRLSLRLERAARADGCLEMDGGCSPAADCADVGEACGVKAACRSAVEGRHLRQKPDGNAPVVRKPEGLEPFGWTAAGRKPGAGCWGQPRPGEERTGWASPPSPCGRPCRAGRPTKEAGARLPAVGLSVQPERSGG